jgi:hypothetical protein
MLKFRNPRSIFCKKEKGERKMKSKLSILATLIIAMLMTSTVSAFVIMEPHPANAMWVEPSAINLTTATSVGYKFNVTVAMNITQNVFTYGVGMKYDNVTLKANKAGFTLPPTSEYMTGHGTTTGIVIDTSYLGPGSVLATESCSGTDFIPGPRSGTLIWVEFEIVSAPGKGQTINSVFNISMYKSTGDTYVSDDQLGVIAFTAFDGTFTYVWQQPTTYPYMGIEHDTGFGPSPITLNPTPATAWPIAYGPSPPAAVGSGFTASLIIKNLDPAWGLTNASFRLSYNSTVIDVLGGLANITINPLWLTSVPSYAPGTIDIFVENYNGVAGGNLLVATVKFTVMIQGANPPQSAVDFSLLTYTNVVFFDHTISIDAGPSDSGRVNIIPLIALPLPYLEVVPSSTIIGPAPSIGSIFCVDIDVVNMSRFWFDIAVQFRLQYDSNVLEFVSATEGGFMTDPQWNLYGTFFISLDNVGDPLFGDHVAVLDMLYPNTTNGDYDQTVFPNTIESPAADATVATVCFRVLQQNCFGLPSITTYLNLPPFWAPTDNFFIDKEANYLPSAGTINATVTILALDFVGRQIDLYGGAVNDGYGVLVGAPYLQFPAPYGGQGPNHWMDIVFPQSWLYLHANVTYNYWPVQSKDVGFEIEGPYEHLPNGTYVPLQRYQIWAKFTATTDSNGVANYAFRMPWPCEDPDGITGVWKITSTVTIADVVVSDIMMFYYERLVDIVSVTTDSYGYYHDECVKVTVSYRTHSVEYYPALFAVVITDDLGVPFGMALYGPIQVGGATFCTWKPDEFTVTICIPKWAYAGNGYVHVSVYDKDPTEGGEALAPEFTPAPEINIYPY